MNFSYISISNSINYSLLFILLLAIKYSSFLFFTILIFFSLPPPDLLSIIFINIFYFFSYPNKLRSDYDFYKFIPNALCKDYVWFFLYFIEVIISSIMNSSENLKTYFSRFFKTRSGINLKKSFFFNLKIVPGDLQMTRVRCSSELSNISSCPKNSWSLRSLWW